MKRTISVILIICMLLVLASCDSGEELKEDLAHEIPTVQPTPEPQPMPLPPRESESEQIEPQETEAVFPGKIAIVTNAIDGGPEEEFRSAEAIMNKFGREKVIIRTWPVYFAQEPEMMVDILTEIALDPYVGAIIINRALINTNAAIDAVRTIRGDDIFIAVAFTAEDTREVYAKVNLSLNINYSGMGAWFVEQASKMGVETIAHYSFPRHMSHPMLAERRDNMAVAAELAGIRFVDLLSPDPMEEGGMPASQLFIFEDVGRQVERLGVNTAFFSNSCGQNITLLQQVLAYGAMYIQPCCPSPFHIFPAIFAIADELELSCNFNVGEIIEVTREIIAAAGMEGRTSNWALSSQTAFTHVGFMYAVEWLNGRVSQEFGVIDEDVLLRLFGDYAEEALGERLYPQMSQVQADSETFSTMFEFLMPFVVF